MPTIIDEQGRREVTQQEYEEYLAELPVHEPVINEIPELEIEYSHDIPSKSLVIVKIKGHEPKELFYPEGFVWDDEWIIINVKPLIDITE